jgi:hypothetical protein
MLPQYKMVLVNGILSILLLLGVLIYKYILKRKINLLYLLILISILPIVSIFRMGSYESGDLSLHTQRLMSFYNLLANYHLIPRWTPEFNAGYGDPHFLFAYFLPYFLGSIFHFIGFSFLMSLKFVLAFSFIASGVAMYFWVREELGDKAGFVSAIFYLFMPYHLVDIHFRATVAENLSFVFLPPILLSIKKNIENGSKKWTIILSVGTGLLILSHQAISVMFSPIIIAYTLFVWFNQNKKKLKSLISCFAFIALGFVLTSFYWLPIIFLAKFTQEGSNPSGIFFPNFIDLFYSPWRFGFLFQGHKGELSYLIGYTQLIVIFLSVYFVFKKMLNKKLHKLLTFFLAIFIVIFIMLLPITKFIWSSTPLLKYSQFSTRLLVPLSLCISIIAGIIVKQINKNWFLITLSILTIAYTILNWGNRRTIPIINDNYLKQEFDFKPDGDKLEPTSPMWADLNKTRLRIRPKSSIEILSGKATVKMLSRTPIIHTYVINAESKVKIKENTLYFPGWTVIANNKHVAIDYSSQKFPGIITFNLNPGIYDVKVEFVDLPIIIFAKWLSGLSVIAILIYAFHKSK